MIPKRERGEKFPLFLFALFLWYAFFMAKLKQPLLSFEAHRSVGDSLTFQRRAGTDYVREKPIPSNPQTLPQMYHRWLYEDYCAWWGTLTSLAKKEWNSDARRYRISGFNLFLRHKLNLMAGVDVHLTLDEKSGAVAFDRSPHNRNFTIIGASPATGVISGGFLFDGLNDELTLPAVQCPVLDSVFTLSFLLYIEAHKNHNWLVTRWQNTPMRCFMCRCKGNQKLNFGLFQSNGAYRAIDTIGLLDAQRWYLLHFVADGTLMKMYIDGVQDPALQTYDGTINTNNTQPLRIGKGDTAFLDGKLDNVIIYNRALTQSEVTRQQGRRWPV